MEIKKTADEKPAEDEKQKKPRTYAVVIGINYKTVDGEKRAEPGDRVSDLPPKSVRWLVEAGAIKEVK
jgi:hypothetical protein